MDKKVLKQQQEAMMMIQQQQQQQPMFPHGQNQIRSAEEEAAHLLQMSMPEQQFSEDDTIDRTKLYKTEMCQKFMLMGYCRYGDKCQFAHGYEELRQPVRHPLYKTSKCKSFHSTGQCRYGSRCRFIHDESETDLTRFPRNNMNASPNQMVTASPLPPRDQQPSPRLFMSPPQQQQQQQQQHGHHHHQQQQQQYDSLASMSSPGYYMQSQIPQNSRVMYDPIYQNHGYVIPVHMHHPGASNTNSAGYAIPTHHISPPIPPTIVQPTPIMSVTSTTTTTGDISSVNVSGSNTSSNSNSSSSSSSNSNSNNSPLARNQFPKHHQTQNGIKSTPKSNLGDVIPRVHTAPSSLSEQLQKLSVNERRGSSSSASLHHNKHLIDENQQRNEVDVGDNDDSISNQILPPFSIPRVNSPVNKPNNNNNTPGFTGGFSNERSMSSQSLNNRALVAAAFNQTSLRLNRNTFSSTHLPGMEENDDINDNNNNNNNGVSFPISMSAVNISSRAQSPSIATSSGIIRSSRSQPNFQAETSSVAEQGNISLAQNDEEQILFQSFFPSSNSMSAFPTRPITSSSKILIRQSASEAILAQGTDNDQNSEDVDVDQLFTPTLSMRKAASISQFPPNKSLSLASLSGTEGNDLNEYDSPMSSYAGVGTNVTTNTAATSANVGKEPRLDFFRTISDPELKTTFQGPITALATATASSSSPILNSVTQMQTNRDTNVLVQNSSSSGPVFEDNFVFDEHPPLDDFN